MPATDSLELDEARLGEFVHRFITDLGAAHHAVTVVVGDRLGLYRALAGTGPATAAEVADAARCDERYTTEWLNAQAASGYCEFDPATGRYHLTPEQIACLADENSPVFLTAGMLLAASLFKDEERLTEAIRSGAGVGWGEHHHDLYVGVERFFRAGYAANLVSSWVPALDGVEEKLRAGALVADVGCGHGASTILLAQAYPNSTIVGFDNHAPSIDAARAAARTAGVADRARFEVASAQDFPGEEYALVCVFDALHDMGDPVGAARHIRASIAGDGTWLLVEPMAGDSVAANLNPIGRLFYSASTLVCTPAARSQPGGWALGAQATDAQLRGVAERGGFTRFRRAVDTPVNRIIEIRP
ncbi:methyltransferase domain-containing protein [Frankia sp. AgB1.9]|uniref:class I SAM-dependent methyltransferase n=1 Tax=unclassified Frankia TaxID=2632575 RepID=UPI001933014A|nr:methyltransferase domain-containing protein [Frankia sp. AgW1.1]MBL7553638.1 methyltransferase domain-containing protein [Frankia sp. AgB1.9]MBL7623603.1 methyltransferase domain-containing protein [Frankia sp. AgB1.8]